MNKYLKALDERRQSFVNSVGAKLESGRVVVIKDSVKCNGKWGLERIESKILGKGGVIRGYITLTGSGYLI